MKQRIFYLDYLRGMCAFFIMIYHYLSWSDHKLEAYTFLGRIGKYGVSMFYILSGLTLFYVYKNRNFKKAKEIKDFFVKRFFRIFPLLYLIILFYILYQVSFGELTYTFRQIFLNLTGLFSLFSWDASIGDGTWSIGNELSFYLIFPIAIIFSDKAKRILFYILLLLSFFSFMYISYWVLDPNMNLETGSQWRNYTNPLNQVFLFLSGIFIGIISIDFKINKRHQFFLFIISATGFVLYPVKSVDSISLITHNNRVVFSILSIFICFSLFRSGRLKGLMHKPLLILGEISYSLYLIHPIVFKCSKKILEIFGFSKYTSLQIALSLMITIVTSYFVYEYYEKYFVKIGKNFLTN